MLKNRTQNSSILTKLKLYASLKSKVNAHENLLRCVI